MLVYVFFCFKQKTAYEMRMSDWSSDVCSSDLLSGVYGVDLNPFAVSIARFRLLVAALQASGIRTLKEAPGWRFNLTTGDSLLHGRRFDLLGADDLSHRYPHVYAAEDIGEINRSEEHTSELQSLMRISYAVFCLKKKK